MRKKLVCAIATMIMTSAVITGCSNKNTEESVDQGKYIDGTYTGVGTGKNGDINVTVTVDGGKIQSIELGEHSETPGIYENAESGVIDSIINTQETNVDIVSGATFSSNGIMQAVENALESASAE